MNRDPITVILAGTLLLSVTATAGLCYWYLQCTREQQQVQMVVTRMNHQRALLQSLAADCAQYARKNPAILPVLQTLGFRNRAEGSVDEAGRP